MSHTPGPWEAFDLDLGEHQIAMGGQRKGSTIEPQRCLTWDHGLDPEDDSQWDELCANIDLIVASPDMLAALQSVEHINIGGIMCCPSCRYVEEAGHAPSCVLRAAVAKATGKEAPPC